MYQPEAYKNAAGKIAYKRQGKLFGLPFAANGELGKYHVYCLNMSVLYFVRL